MKGLSQQGLVLHDIGFVFGDHFMFSKSRIGMGCVCGGTRTAVNGVSYLGFLSESFQIVDDLHFDMPHAPSRAIRPSRCFGGNGTFSHDQNGSFLLASMTALERLPFSSSCVSVEKISSSSSTWSESLYKRRTCSSRHGRLCIISYTG